MTRRAWRLIATLALLASLVLAVPGVSGAAVSDTTYRGYGTVAAAGYSYVGAYRWAPTGWSPTTLATGTVVSVYPFGSGWSWAWYAGAWYAVPSAYIDAAAAGYPAAIWTADAGTRGMSAWKSVQAPPNSVFIDSDPYYGSVYRVESRPGETWTDGKARSEMYGSKLTNGTTYDYHEGDDLWYGWRSRVNTGMVAPTSGSTNVNLLQLKGDSDCGGPAVGLTFQTGSLRLRSELYGVIWNGPAAASFAGPWHTFVLHVRYSKSHANGLVELWYDGVRQQLAGGSGSYQVATMCPNDTRVYIKMGVYRSTTIPGTTIHWISTPRIGSSYGAVVPR